VGWRDLIESEPRTVTLPWVGGQIVHSESRAFIAEGLPPEFGWYRFAVKDPNYLVHTEAVEPDLEILKNEVSGYLVGDRLVPDNTYVDPDPSKIVKHSEKVYMLPDGLDRFARARAGRVFPEGPLIFIAEEFPLGPEEDVLDAFLDEKEDVKEIKGVTTGLDAAFRMETFRRAEAERRRVELARKRAEEEARRAQEKRRQELLEKLGDGAGRRAMAKENFAEAAKAALTVGGAQYLDHRRVGRGDDYAVKYRVDGQRLECICSSDLHIVDAGVCLTDHTTGEKGDTYFTLESLPAVIREAIRDGVLVVWRHV